MILVTGATGTTSPGVVRGLREAGVDVRALVRNESKAQSLRDMGAEIFVGDLDKPETIFPAVEGVDKIFLLTANGEAEAQHGRNVIEAAKRAGNPHIVRYAGFGSEKSRIVKNQQEVAVALQSSGLPWTLLTPTFFMQNTMLAAQTVASDGVIYWQMQDAHLAMIDARDATDAAVAILTGSGHEGKTYVLTGPASISFHDVASAFSKVLGKEVQYVKVPREALIESMLGMGLSEWTANGFAELMEGFIEGFAETTTETVKQLTGHPARSFETFAHDFAQVFGASS